LAGIQKVLSTNSGVGNPAADVAATTMDMAGNMYYSVQADLSASPPSPRLNLYALGFATFLLPIRSCSHGAMNLLLDDDFLKRICLSVLFLGMENFKHRFPFLPGPCILTPSLTKGVVQCSISILHF